MDGKETESEAPAEKPGILTVYMERYGWAAVVAFTSLLAVELAIFTPLIHFGVDLSPLARWGHDTLGIGSGEVAVAQPSWFAALVAAYVVSRVIKPFTLPLALAMTPFVARRMGHTETV